MDFKEVKNIFAAFLVLTVVAGFTFAYHQDWVKFPEICIYSVIILFFAIGAKKLMAFWLDADVEHEIWQFSRYGWKPHWYLKKPIPGGVVFPLFLSLFSLGFFKFLAILTFETKPSKYRAAKRHGFYSFTEMTDWHNAIIASSGIVAMFIIAIITYLTDYSYLGKIAIYYAFSNMIPISKSDGAQLFFGSRILYTILAVITLIFFAYALFL